MAVVSGTSTRYNIVGDREDLANSIYDISPVDTPFFSSAKRGKAKSTFHEWQTDSLAAATTANAYVEGDEASFSTPSPTVRVGNYTQISRKTLIVSDTLEEMDLAGRKSEMAFQLAKQSKEIKRDMESIFLSNQAANAGGLATPRRLASMGAWLKTNVDLATNGANPAYTSGAPMTARTDGVGVRAFTQTILKSVIQQAWTNGGEPRTLMVGPYNKTVVSGFEGIAETVVNVGTGTGPTTILAAADVFVSDFGKVRVIPNRFQRERDAWLLDFSLISVPYLRSFRTKNLAPTGDAEKKMLVVEYTLRVNQEAGLGLAADLTTAAGT